MHGNRSYASRNGAGILRQEKRGRCMKGKVREKTIMRARAAVLQFWLSSFPNKILFICSNIAHLDTFWFMKVKSVKISSCSTHKESTTSLFYRLAYRLLILNNLQIPRLQRPDRCILLCRKCSQGIKRYLLFFAYCFCYASCASRFFRGLQDN